MKSRSVTLLAYCTMVAGIPAAGVSVAVAQTEPLSCDNWNTLEFFEGAMADDVLACLPMGADPRARSDDGHTPLHRAADANTSPAVLAVLLEAGADMQAQAAGDGHTPLHEASGNPELGMIEYLFLSGGDLEAQATDGATLLHYAAYSNQNPDVIDFLIANGADENARRDDGITPLHNAARNNGNPAIVERLVAAGADVNVQLDDGQTPLLFAAQYNESLAVTRALIGEGADPELVPDWGGSALNFASASEYPEVTQFFIDLGGDPNEQDDSGRMSLHIAGRYSGNADVTRTLITAGANPNAQDGDGESPLHVVAQYNANNPDVIDALLVAGVDPNVQDDGGETPLHVAARNAENPAVIEALLDRDADPNAQTEDGRTPLYSAAEGNANVAAIQVLIAAGADPNAQVQYYGGPLHRAARSNPNPAVVKALLRAGADLHGQTEYGGTAFHRAALNENPAVIETFLRAGVDVNRRGDFGELAVHSAAEFNGNPEVIQALLRAGADPYLDDDGTALHAAARSDGNSVAVLQALIDFGMEVTVRTSSGRTPLHDVKAPENAEFLLANGADPRRRDASGETALHRGSRWDLESELVLELVALLVNAGGNVNARDENGRTPIHDIFYPEQADALLAHGADINAQDEDGNTRLHLASGCEFGSCYFASELIIALLDAGADATIRNAQGQTPWELASANENEEFSGSDGYWQLNEARFNAPSTQNMGTSSGVAVSSLPSPTSASSTQSGANERCEIPGFYDGDVMDESVMENLRLSWCPHGSGSRLRLFALQAELAWCRLNVEPPPENMSQFLQASRQTCASLAVQDEQARNATGGFVIGDEAPAPYVRCRCPAHYFQ